MLNYARIKDGVVVNILYVDSITAEMLTNVVCIEDFPVGIGDTYVDGVFYRDGEKIPNYDELKEVVAQRLLLEEMDAAYREGVNSV